jgi:hypothetical protein
MKAPDIIGEIWQVPLMGDLLAVAFAVGAVTENKGYLIVRAILLQELDQVAAAAGHERAHPHGAVMLARIKN